MDYFSILIALVCIITINAAIWVALAQKPHPHNSSHPEIQLIALNSMLKHSVEARSSTVKRPTPLNSTCLHLKPMWKP